MRSAGIIKMLTFISFFFFTNMVMDVSASVKSLSKAESHKYITIEGNQIVRYGDRTPVKVSQIPSGSVIEIDADIEVAGAWLLPDNCVIRFSGGVVTANRIVGKNTVIDSPAAYMFKVGKMEGTWRVERAFPEWFHGTDNSWSDAVDRALTLNPVEICFTHGIYDITRPIVTTSPNVYIAHGATLRASQSLRQPIEYMICGDFSGRHTVAELALMPKIYGGGCIDGNGMAKTGVTFYRSRQSALEGLTIQNTTEYGFKASRDETVAGNCIVSNCVFQNWLKNPAAKKRVIAILNNRTDCVYEDIEIVDYQIAVRHDGLNGKYTNVHAWLLDATLWNSSVVFDCQQPDLTLLGCEADTMCSLIRFDRPYFFASIVNCRAYVNESVVDLNAVDSKGNPRYAMPLVIDKTIANASKDRTQGAKGRLSQIMLYGGVFWYELGRNTLKYRIVDEMSPHDQIELRRYQRSQLREGALYGM